MNNYRIADDCNMLRDIRDISQRELADELGVGLATISRLESGSIEPDKNTLEKFYSYAYISGLRLNRIKEQFYMEENPDGAKLLFHGAKSVISGGISHDRARSNNDFGRGFYMGESFKQAGLFVSNFEDSCVYALKFDDTGLVRAEYHVDTEWMLTVACFRGRLKNRISEEKTEKLCSKAMTADYIVAPIADNRMYQILDAFIDGEITDEQCRHALAATELGMQYVARTSRATDRIEILERCYLCAAEKEGLAAERKNDLRYSEDKVRAARIKYRGKGRYIDELL